MFCIEGPAGTLTGEYRKEDALHYNAMLKTLDPWTGKPMFTMKMWDE